MSKPIIAVQTTLYIKLKPLYMYTFFHEYSNK